MINILICDDNELDRKYLSRLVEDFFESLSLSCKIDCLRDFVNINDCFSAYDIIFLDIELESRNGINLANEIRKYNQDIIIIITSNYQKYLVEGYTIEAKRYFLKPINKEIFNMEMKNVINTQFKQHYGFDDPKISRQSIYYKDICHIEFLGRKTILHCINNNEFIAPYPLKYWIERLTEVGFAQSYKSYLVNLLFVTGFSKDEKDVILINDEMIPLSRKYKKTFMEQYYRNLRRFL